MKRFIFIIALTIVLTPLASHAKILAGVGANVNYQLTANGRTYESRQPLSVRAGYRFPFADVYGEYSQVESSSGIQYVSIATLKQEFLLWIRKGDPTAKWIKPYVALGAGVHTSTITTRLAQNESRDSGAPEILGAAVGGVQIRVLRGFEIDFEGRASFAPSYAPNPVLGLGAFLSIAI